MVRNGLKRSRVLYKFVVYQTKGLVSNNRGKPIYMDSFDRVIYDLYGIKHFSRKIAEYYDDRDIMDLIDHIGLDQLLRLMKNTRFCNVVRELVRIDDDTESLSKEIRKMRRKGKTNKHMLREFNDLKKLYEKGIKSLRRRLGIRDARTAYKRKYMAVRDLVSGGRYEDYDYDDFDAFGRDPYHGDYDPYDHKMSYDPYDDDYDDRDEYYDEDSSELEDFVTMLNGPSPNKRRKPARRQPEYYEEDDDPYDRSSRDDLEEYEEYHRGEAFRHGEYESQDERIDILTDKMAELTDAVQALTSQARYDQVNHRNPVTHRPENFAREYIPPVRECPTPKQGVLNSVESQALGSLMEEVKQLREGIGYIIPVVKDLQDWKEELIDVLTDEDDEDDIDVEMNPPVVENESNYYQELANKYPDVYETPMEDLPEDNVVPKVQKTQPVTKKDPDQMSRKELIDEVNQTQAKKASWSNGQKEPQTAAREPKKNPAPAQNDQNSEKKGTDSQKKS